MQINFYHLTKLPIEKGLPKLLEKVHQAEYRVLLLAGDDARIEHFNQQLWSYTTKYFLPHGSKKDGYSDKQPIYLTTASNDNPNKATVLAMVDDVQPESFDGFERAIYMFDGADDAQVKTARTRWKAYKDAGYELVYWQQNAKGGWEKKAA